MDSQTITMLIPVAIVAFILWVRARNRRLQREHHEELAQKWRETHKTPEEKEVERAVRRKQLVAEFNARRAARSARSQLKHPENYTEEEIQEAVARGFIPPDDPAVGAVLRPGERSERAADPESRDLGREDRNFMNEPEDLDLRDDLNDSEFDDDLRGDFADDLDKDFEDPDLRDDFDDDPDNLDDSDFDDDSEDDWDREDAVMRAQSNLRIMREEDQNYALDAIEAEVLNLDHEPDEDELVAIADRAADFYDMSEDYRDY